MFELQSQSFVNQAKKLQNPSLNNIGDDTLLQAIPGGTGHVQKLVELMRGQLIFCCSRLRLQLIAIYCNRRGLHTDTPHTAFFLLRSAHTQ